MILSGVEPRMTGIHLRAIDGFSNGPMLIIHIPKSWAGPHLITFKNTSKFFSRTSNGKYQLDVQEIRSAFIQSEEIGKKAREFRQSRLGVILAEETPVPLMQYSKVVLHLMPVNFSNFPNQVDIAACEQLLLSKNPIYSSRGSFRFNFDGAVHFDVTAESKSSSYLQLFRSGIIETVSSYFIRPREGQQLIPSIPFEEKLISALTDYLILYKELELEPPIMAFLSLLFVKGFSIAAHSSGNDQSNPIERDHLILPDLLIEDFNQEASVILRPWFDNIWQACGWDKSISYDDEGNFLSRS